MFLGGGNGKVLTAILSANPTMKGILFDQPFAVDGARSRIEAEAIAERCEIIGGDFFGALPPGADAYIQSISHDFPMIERSRY